MWGPPSAMVESPSTDGLQGIVPRIFDMLFSKIQKVGFSSQSELNNEIEDPFKLTNLVRSLTKDQENSDGRQISYQCRCSFLEVSTCLFSTCSSLVFISIFIM